MTSSSSPRGPRGKTPAPACSQPAPNETTDPQWFFRVTGLPPLNHPAIFACLGMVIGLYGVLYLEVARVPERGWLLAAVGLAGNLIWWLPFGLYLHDAWPGFRADLAGTRNDQLQDDPR